MKNLYRAILRGAVAALLSAAADLADAANPADPSGTWAIEDGSARVRLERCGPTQERICGYIVWMKDQTDPKGQPYRDRNNPDQEKSSRPLLGHQLILGAKPTPEGRFDGEIYNAENGKSYSVALWRESADRLKLKGCMLMLCSTQTWRQTHDVSPGQLVGLTGDPNGPRADREWAGLQPKSTKGR